MPKKILLVAVEMAEVAAVGGVAEYVLGLATALLKQGHDVRVALPAYQYILSSQQLQKLPLRLPVPLGVGASEVTDVYRLELPCPGNDALKLPVMLLGSHKHFASVTAPKYIYQWPNPEPWIAFSRAVIEYVNSGDWTPDIIHCQDAHTALMPVYIANFRGTDPDRTTPFGQYAAQVRTLLTIHNLLYQGSGDPGLVSYAGLPSGWFNSTAFEHWGHANCFKAGLTSADMVNTVSKTYAKEIAGRPRFGQGLEGVLANLTAAKRLRGIVNGIDEARWRMAGVKYDGTDKIEEIIAAKACRRQKLYGEWGWQDNGLPIVAFRGRCDYQKNLQAVAAAAERIMKVANLLIVTWGYDARDVDPKSLQAWRKLMSLQGDRLRLNTPGLSDKEQTADNYTIADFFLMPSRYEPCGLAQMECQRFGTIPIVRKTGGLADTVSEQPTKQLPSPNGFVFTGEEGLAVAAAVERAVKSFADSATRNKFIANALIQQNSWATRVPEYEALYGLTP